MSFFIEAEEESTSFKMLPSIRVEDFRFSFCLAAVACVELRLLL